MWPRLKEVACPWHLVITVGSNCAYQYIQLQCTVRTCVPLATPSPIPPLPSPPSHLSPPPPPPPRLPSRLWISQSLWATGRDDLPRMQKLRYCCCCLFQFSFPAKNLHIPHFPCKAWGRSEYSSVVYLLPWIPLFWFIPSKFIQLHFSPVISKNYHYYYVQWIRRLLVVW